MASVKRNPKKNYKSYKDRRTHFKPLRFYDMCVLPQFREDRTSFLSLLSTDLLCKVSDIKVDRPLSDDEHRRWLKNQIKYRAGDTRKKDPSERTPVKPRDLERAIAGKYVDVISCAVVYNVLRDWPEECSPSLLTDLLPVFIGYYDNKARGLRYYHLTVFSYLLMSMSLRDCHKTFCLHIIRNDRKMKISGQLVGCPCCSNERYQIYRELASSKLSRVHLYL